MEAVVSYRNSYRLTVVKEEATEMGEQLITLQGLPALGEQLLFVAGACCMMILGTVFLLLFASDRTRARGHELNSRHKLGHETLQKEVPALRIEQ